MLKKINIIITMSLFFIQIDLKCSTTINACISTVGWREKSLNTVIECILPQVDKIFVFLQFYDKIPTFLNHEKITILNGEDYPEILALGSSAKFFWADKIEGYYITIDDDIIYPSDYVEYCIEKIENYKRKAVVGFHGSLFNNKDDFSEIRYNYFDILSEDKYVHMLGTGVMAYHTDTIRITMKDFNTKNQDDLWFALAAQTQKIPMICLERDKNYIEIINEAAYHVNSISVQYPKLQQRLAKNYAPWTLFEAY